MSEGLPSSNPKDVAQATVLLDRVADGDSTAAAELFPIVYDQLRLLAGRYFRGQQVSHTLQPTAVLHEAYLKLIGSGTDWESRAHFLAVAAKAMRQVLINHAREKGAAKRSGKRVDMTTSDLPDIINGPIDPVVIDEALNRLSALDANLAELVELRIFGGLSVEDIAHVTNKSESTVKRQWRQVRAWLSQELSGT